ncbi:MAG: lipid-A-disaccharide synthase [Chthonomonadales bacterium]
MGPNVAIVAGEASGDLVGGMLAAELRRLRPDVRIWGIGSRHLHDAGVELLYDSASWGSIGVVEALRWYPSLRFRVYPHLVREIAARNSACVILIDFGAFNMQVARWCARRKVKVLYYFPPGSWRRDGRGGEELARLATFIATPFPWSAQYLASLGARVEFVGHPLLEAARPVHPCTQFAESLRLDVRHPIVGLLPGSRTFEMKYNIPVMLEAAAAIYQRLPDVQFVFALAATADLNRVNAEIRWWEQRASRQVAAPSDPPGRQNRRRVVPSLVTPEGVLMTEDALKQRPVPHASARTTGGHLPIVVTQGRTYDVMAYSDVLLVCSGSATLEAAILGTPMVIVYRGSRIMELEYKLRRLHRIEHIGMPNIVCGRRVVPELIQRDATPQALAEHALRFLLEPETRAATKAALEEVRAALGEPGATARVARIAVEMLQQGTVARSSQQPC